MRRLILGNCLEVLRELADESVDAVVTDPPYGLGSKEPTPEDILAYLSGGALDTHGDFMGKAWEIPPITVWQECHRVLKPGGHLLSFGGTRTFDLISMGIRMAGFEDRDTIADFAGGVLSWVQGQGFPKSLDISKAIDKVAFRPEFFERIRDHIRYWRDQRGFSNSSLNEALGFSIKGSNMLGDWTSTQKNRTAIPTKDNWQRLRDVLQWPDNELDAVYSKVKDGAERPVVGEHLAPASSMYRSPVMPEFVEVTDSATPEAKQWAGWGTALKPAWEPILVFRKPLAGTVADNVLEHGVGGINIDGCRVKMSSKDDINAKNPHTVGGFGHASAQVYGDSQGAPVYDPSSGRWPPNVVLIHLPGCKQVGSKRVKQRPVAWPGGVMTRGSVSLGRMDSHDAEAPQVRGPSVEEEIEDWECEPGCPVKALDEQTKDLHGAWNKGGEINHTKANKVYAGEWKPERRSPDYYGNEGGGASRFFPQFPGQEPPEAPFFYTGKATKGETTLDGQVENKHPTKKPLALMKWLVKLVCPPEGVVLDPYCGSGTTCVAAVQQGSGYIGIERDPDYFEIAKARLDIVEQEYDERKGQTDLFEAVMGMGEEDS